MSERIELPMPLGSTAYVERDIKKELLSSSMSAPEVPPPEFAGWDGTNGSSTFSESALPPVTEENLSGELFRMEVGQLDNFRIITSPYHPYAQRLDESFNQYSSSAFPYTKRLADWMDSDRVTPVPNAKLKLKVVADKAQKKKLAKIAKASKRRNRK